MASNRFRLLNIPRTVYGGMLWHALAERPLECCGLLAGVVREDGVGEVLLRYPLLNAAASPVEFESEPRSHFSADRDIRRQGLEVLAIYHSHPTSEPVPSRKDLERSYWGTDVVNLIVSLTTPTPAVRAWWLSTQEYCEAQWVIQDNNDRPG
ncbi:MAG TPA: M67 family metallopeptidase [Gemmataceae bacterium]|nr:M67 family metallopeptidase [Gemmataceae bacterium]